MSKEIIFKQCSEEDVASISEIGAKTFEETFASVNSKEDMEKYLQKDFNTEQILSEVQNPESIFMLAQVKENDSLLPVGYMKVNFGSAQTEKSYDNSMEIQRIYVAKSCMGGSWHRKPLYGLRSKACRRKRSCLCLARCVGTQLQGDKILSG